MKSISYSFFVFCLILGIIVPYTEADGILDLFGFDHKQNSYINDRAGDPPSIITRNDANSFPQIDKSIGGSNNWWNTDYTSNIQPVTSKNSDYEGNDIFNNRNVLTEPNNNLNGDMISKFKNDDDLPYGNNVDNFGVTSTYESKTSSVTPFIDLKPVNNDGENLNLQNNDGRNHKPVNNDGENLKPVNNVENLKPVNIYVENLKPVNNDVENLKPVNNYVENPKVVNNYIENLKPVNNYVDNPKVVNNYVENLKPVNNDGKNLKPFNNDVRNLKPINNDGESLKPMNNNIDKMSNVMKPIVKRKFYIQVQPVVPMTEQEQYSEIIYYLE